jgi:hypothetical protein
MDFVLHWNTLVDYYGSEFAQYQHSLKKAGRTTQAVLACRWSASDKPLFRNANGPHAEDVLLSDSIWTRDIPNAIAAWSEHDSSPMFITLAINRSPCGRCAEKLSRALNDLGRQYPWRAERQYFLLAMRGYYESQRFMAGRACDNKTSVTTIGDLQQLHRAGWVPLVLLFDNEIAQINDPDLRKLPRARGLLEALIHLRSAHRL